MKFDQIIDEAVNSRVIGWNNNPSIGWIAGSDLMHFYYGTDVTKVKQILRDGIYAGDDGYVLLAAEPYSALAHSQMRSQLIEGMMFDDNDDIIIVVEFPRNYLAKKHLLVENDSAGRFTNKELYENWGKSDVEYYALIEVRVPEYVPVEFIKGYTKNNG